MHSRTVLLGGMARCIFLDITLWNICSTSSSFLFVTTGFTSDEISKFQRRFEEGYDVPDAQYEHWLELYHPETKLSNEGSGYNPLSQASVSSDSSTQQQCRINPPQTSLSKFCEAAHPSTNFHSWSRRIQQEF